MLPTLLLVLFARAGGDPGNAAALATIRADDARTHVEFLASDEMEGREAGTETEKVAATYLATRLASYGLKPGGDAGGWFQDFKRGDRTMRNVVGIVEGTDPKLRSQAVVLGAHYDHVGRGGSGAMGKRGEIHNGADDNASGTAAILELAQAFAKAPQRRTLVFVHFSGEEKGLFGSIHYVKSPPIPLADTVAMLNLDMIGRSVDDYLFVGGVGTAPDWPAVVARATEAEGLKIETGEEGRAPSDNTPFYEKGIPCLFLFTNIHEDYHGPGDDAEKVVYDGIERIARAGARITIEVADRDARPVFEETGSGQALPKDFMERMAKLTKAHGAARGGASRTVRLGVIPGASHDDGGLVLETVDKGGAADHAGLKSGDVLLFIDEHPVNDFEEMLEALARYEPGAVAKVKVRRAGKIESVDVTFSAPESRPRRRRS